MSAQSWRFPRFDLSRTTASGIFTLFGVVVAVLALAILEPLQSISSTPASKANDLSRVVELVVAIALATAGMYALVKFDLTSRLSLSLQTLTRGLVAVVVILFLGGYCMVFFFALLGPQHTTLSFVLGYGLVSLMILRSNWPLVNTVALCLAPVFAAILGQQLALAPVLLVMVLLIAYDIVAVYVTGHMVELAEGVLNWRITLPVLVSLPLAGGTRDRTMLGVGDLVIPGMLVTSAALWSPAPAIIGPANLPALWAVAGIAVGHVGMHAIPDRSKPHAGLPFLNTGAIAGYVAGSLVAGLSLTTALGLNSAAVSGVVAI